MVEAARWTELLDGKSVVQRAKFRLVLGLILIASAGWWFSGADPSQVTVRRALTWGILPLLVGSSSVWLYWMDLRWRRKASVDWTLSYDNEVLKRSGSGIPLGDATIKWERVTSLVEIDDVLVFSGGLVKLEVPRKAFSDEETYLDLMRTARERIPSYISVPGRPTVSAL